MVVGAEKGSIFVKCLKIFFSETIQGSCRNLAYILRTLASTEVVFYSSRIRTLVVMATYISHRFIMVKVEINNFCQVIGDI